MSIPDRPLMPFRPLAWVTVKATGQLVQVYECRLHAGLNGEYWTFAVLLHGNKYGEFSADELE